MAEKSARNVDFLHQQAARLSSGQRKQDRNTLLTSHDEETLPLSLETTQTSWLANKNMFTPVLTEYDNVIAQLQQKISSYQTELASLNSRVEQITTENGRLHQQLCETVESQLVTQMKGEEGRGGTVGKSTAALQNQLLEISKERDEFRGKLKQMTYELEFLQRSDREKTQCLDKYKTELTTAEHNVLTLQQKMEELQTACVNLNEEYNKCVESARSGGKEVDELSKALQESQVQCKSLDVKSVELLQANYQLTQQLRKQKAERQALDGKGRVIDGRIHLLELTNTELEAKLAGAQSNVNLLTKKNGELEESVARHQTRLSGLEKEVQQAVAHVKESMDMVESAILDKDQAVIVSEQKTQEAERLREAMEALLQEAGQRTLREVESVRAEYNRNIDKMVEEIQKLEEECGQKQTLVERAQRERRAMQLELEQIKERIPAEVAKSGESIQKLQARVFEAENVANDAQRRLKLALATQQAAENGLEEEKRRNKAECGDLRKRLREREIERGRESEEKTQMASQLRELMEQLRSEREEREAVERRAKQEMAVVSQQCALKERELQQRLQAREESHNKSIEELREMLTSQFDVTTRWKEESKSMTDKFEETVKSLRSEVTSQKRKLASKRTEMDSLNKQNQQHKRQIDRLQSSQSQLQRQLRDSESRAEEAATQVCTLLEREKQLQGDRRELQRQLDKLKLEITRRADLAMAIPPTSGPFRFHTSTPMAVDPLASSVPPGGNGWEEALSGLRQTIRHARRELEESRVQVHNMDTLEPPQTKPPYTDSYRASSPDCSSITTLSQNSTLHRPDLSTNSLPS